MRDSLRKSLADTPATGFEWYAKGSIVICNACAKPVFKLDRAINLGEGAGKAASAFKPLGLADIDTLAHREDIDAGVRAFARSMTFEQRKAFIAGLIEIRAGMDMKCPICSGFPFQVIATEKQEVLDGGGTIEMLTIPPSGKALPIRGRRIGANAEWVH